MLHDPTRNRDTGFSHPDRAALGIRGLLPWRVTTIEEQVELELEHLRSKSDDLERYIGLAALQDRNETLYYRLLTDHLEQLAPIVYTPTVGRACNEFSHVMRRPRGVWITPDDIDAMPTILRNSGLSDVRLIVATDNERILGLGDQGAGGMGIPIGKLALYSAGAGIHPRLTLPVSLDCGTDNAALRSDPHYLGYPGPRLRGADYDAYVERFVEAVCEVFPDALLQWEDFKQHNAIRLLDRYRDRLPSFNDDIQGTAAVVVAGLLATLRGRRERMCDQRVVMLGAGAAGIGIARLVRTIMHAEGASPTDTSTSVVLLDSHGLVHRGRSDLADDKVPFALSTENVASLGLSSFGEHHLAEVVEAVSPTILVGTSGVAGSFDERSIRSMAARCPSPIVLPLSNPTANAEATPRDVLAWSEGRAVVATGSPFDPVVVGDSTRTIGQANNVFVFPGVGLGVIASRARRVTDEMFVVAAHTLAGLVGDERLATGAMYPPLGELRTVSRQVAVAVAREAVASGVGTLPDGLDAERAVAELIWEPVYT